MTTAVLLSCHGTVSRVEDIPAFLNNIRRGRPTPPELVAEIRHRFERIGGSPLMTITAAQGRALEGRIGIPVEVSGRLWHPYIKDVLQRLVEGGARTVISLPLAPQSVHVYNASVREAAAAYPDVTIRGAPPWGNEPALIDAFIETIDEALAPVPAEERAGFAVVLSAHSLPMRVLAAGDPYEHQFKEMAGAVAARLQARGMVTRIAFQSQGASNEAWLGPDLPTTFSELHAAGARDVLVAPIGFVADHVETLYDLDVEGPDMAAKAGLVRFLRARALNDRPRFIDALEAVVRREMAAIPG
ncbi:ferrochelatase [Polyangium aurulentum]|uniref:ferrochelatase n=1 Tax=Polyangium aurulentum TaxID=2567896 RepID=UPI0010AEBBA8|nr:ferrochelatase [Polyangium aurulentum]UQA62038.1 ferrochelatase [Polyangium aurulentum]